MRTNRNYILLLAAVLLPNMAEAQNSAIEEFQKARQEMLGSYKSFRKSVLDGYADYLNQVWKEYKSFKGEVRDEVPKPKTLPDVKKEPAMDPKEELPPVSVMPQVTVPPVDVKPKVSLPAFTSDEVVCSFYGTSVKMPKTECVGIESFSPERISEAWRAYEAKGMARTAADLKRRAGELGLNDWFTYEMVQECVQTQCGARSTVERSMLMLYLLANMGYDVRMASDNNEPCLLIAIEQKVYGRGYMQLDGKNYYMYYVEGVKPKEGGGLYTYEIPKDVETGRVLDMRIKNGPKIGNGEHHHCQVEFAGITVAVDVDVAQMEMLRHYPQMDVAQYAMSEVSPQLRRSVLEQIKPQIEGLPTAKAADKLLRFVQSAFAYATDYDQHGYEKAYFLEENFYYPKNDCEDRAIFYAYLVRNLLGLDVHLVNFPGHECTAVCFGNENVDGTGYEYEGKKYIICDPTYIGASIGQCMPQYRGVAPKAETFY